MFSGGNLRKLTVFALGIMPYITASIILQLLTVVYEPLAKLQKEGEMGRRKITQYTAERSQRAGEIDIQAAQINEILGKIESLSKGKYNLQAYRLPADVTADKAGVARVQALVDNGSLRGLGDKLSAIGSEASAASTGIDMGLGSGGTVPTGTQAPITVSDQQQIALLAMEAAKRLVPSSAQTPNSAPCYYAVARFLFSDGIIAASQDGLQNQVPQAEAFLNKMAKTLSDGIDDTAKELKHALACGGSAKGGQIVLQGDHKKKMKSVLVKMGYTSESIQVE